MKTSYHIKDYKDQVLNVAIERNVYDYYAKDELMEAIEYLIKINTRYAANGNGYNSIFGKYTECTQPTRIDEEDVIHSFACEARGEAFRKKHGYR